jgi:hypothetical protein
MVKVKVSLIHTTQAQRGGRCIALPILDPGTRMWWWVIEALPHLLYFQERRPLSTVEEAGWALGPVRVGPKSLAVTMV